MNLNNGENSFFYVAEVTYRNSEIASGNLQTGKKGPFILQDIDGYEEAYEEFCRNILDFDDLKKKIERNQSIISCLSWDNRFHFTLHQPYGAIHNWSCFTFLEEPKFLQSKDYYNKGNAIVFFSPKNNRFEINNNGEWQITLLSTDGKPLRDLCTGIKANKNDFDFANKLFMNYSLSTEHSELICNGILVENLLEFEGFKNYTINIDKSRCLKSNNIQNLFVG